MSKQPIRVNLPGRDRLLARVCDRLERHSSRRRLRRLDVALLALAWGNLGYAAGVSYLRHVGERVRDCQGPILECGSGATTLLVAALTAREGVRCVVLEHDRAWYEHLSRVLDKLGYDHVHLIHAPLRDYRNYGWYQVPLHLVPQDIRLVICDGPPGSVPGGRYGLMPVMGSRLTHDCVILLDDTHRAAERRIVDAWRKYRCLTANRLGAFGTHAEVVCC